MSVQLLLAVYNLQVKVDQMTSTTLDSRYLPTHFYQNGQLTVDEDVAVAFQQKVEARLSTLPPEHHGTFLGLLSLPQFTSIASLDASSTDQILDRLEGATRKLGEFTSLDSSGTLARVIAKALYDSATTQRTNELESRLVAREIVKGKMEGQAAKSRESAEETRTGAIVSIVMSTVSAAVSLVMSAVSIAGAAKGLASAKSGSSATKMEANLDAQAKVTTNMEAKSHLRIKAAEFHAKATDAGALSQSHLSKAQNIATLGGVANQLGSTGSNAASALTQANAKDDEAISQQIAAQAEETRKETDQAESIQKALDEMLKAIIEFIKSMREVETDRMAAISNINRG